VYKDTQDELGKLVDSHVEMLSSLSWTSFVTRARGKSCIAPLVATLPHPAANLLDELRKVGAPVLSTTPEWSAERRQAAIDRGSHKSATEYHEFVNEEMTDMINKRYWVVLPYALVKNLPNLRLSPLGVVPQRARRPRIIVDYTFSGVNGDTDRRAHRQSMQFGRALIRVLQTIFFAPPEHGPVYMLKLDLSDGFYRIPVKAQDSPRLAVALPCQPNSPPMVAFPLVLPMGWTDSPPHFSSATETITDLANRWMPHWNPPMHPLEPQAAAQPESLSPRVVFTGPVIQPPITCLPQPPASLELGQGRTVPAPPTTYNILRRRTRAPAQHADVYVDDELLVAQGCPKELARLRRVLMHINDLVFRPNDQGDTHTGRREPMSLSKFAKGDACWATAKIILGWLLDALAKTIELPPHRIDRLLTILNAARHKKRLGRKSVQQLLGELRSMVLGIPGGAGLFSQLQVALTNADGHRVKVHQGARDHIEDLWVLAKDVANRPTHLGEIIEQQESFIGAVDASKAGMGGVWLPPTYPTEHEPDHSPIVWRQPFPAKIAQKVVSFDNPSGTVSNSDLELAGTIGHADIAVHAFDCRHRTIGTCCDNTPAVAWRAKGSTTTSGPASYLLREASIHQRRYRYLNKLRHIPGLANGMADDASRLFHLTDQQLLTHFDFKYPQKISWQLHQLRPETNSSLISALLTKRPSRPSLAAVPNPKRQCGVKPGSPFWTNSTSPTIPTWNAYGTKSQSSVSLPLASATAAPVVAATRSALAGYLTRSWQWRRASPNWGPLIPGSTFTAPSTSA
jgi:hypothetical protein